MQVSNKRRMGLAGILLLVMLAISPVGRDSLSGETASLSPAPSPSVSGPQPTQNLQPIEPSQPPQITQPVKPDGEQSVAEKIVLGAREEVIRGVRYDAGYQRIAYPMGDVDAGVGACTDVVIRALRHAGYDLQQLIHEDIIARKSVYQRETGLGQVDSNIDHRRIPSQIVFFKKYGLELTKEYTEQTKADWQPGDIVYWRMPWEMNHTGIVSDQCNEDGVPLVIHNAYLAVEEDTLLAWKIIGHFRYPVNSPQAAAGGGNEGAEG